MPACIKPDPHACIRRPRDYDRLWSDDLLKDVELLVERCGRQGLETLMLDLTRPDMGLYVVKEVVPGLRHFWPRFGPGRLYETPVTLGLLERATEEERLNPVPLFS